MTVDMHFCRASMCPEAAVFNVIFGVQLMKSCGDVRFSVRYFCKPI